MRRKRSTLEPCCIVIALALVLGSAGFSPAVAAATTYALVVGDDAPADTDVHEAHEGDVLFIQPAHAVESIRLLSPVEATAPARSWIGRAQIYHFDEGQVLYRTSIDNDGETALYCSMTLPTHGEVRGCLAGPTGGEVLDSLWLTTAPYRPAPMIAGGTSERMASLDSPVRYEHAPAQAAMTLVFEYLWGAGPRIGVRTLSEGRPVYLGFTYVPFQARGPFPEIVNVGGARFEILNVHGTRISYRVLNGVTADRPLPISTVPFSYQIYFYYH